MKWTLNAINLIYIKLFMGFSMGNRFIFKDEDHAVRRLCILMVSALITWILRGFLANSKKKRKSFCSGKFEEPHTSE